MKKEEGSSRYGLSQIGDILCRDFEIITKKWIEKERKEAEDREDRKYLAG